MLTGESGSQPLSEKRKRPQTHKSGQSQGKKSSQSRGTKSGDQVRLNKFIAAAGICSRREADQLISAGLITVNGKSVTQLGSKVNPGDDVRYNGERIQSERKVYLLLNKPKDYVTTTDDPRERKTVMLLIRDACSERIYPVGRLDRNTTGVLLFTNDGDLAKKMTHPSHNKKKIYHVFLNKGLSGNDLQKLAAGITLEDGFIQPDAISYASSENKREIGLEIHSGKNRIVRRMFESLGYRVDKLDRVYFGGLTKKNLPRGKWRFLSEKEVNMLKMNAYE
jgi:23S rRNA pseudouridine2605 synthase